MEKKIEIKKTPLGILVYHDNEEYNEILENICKEGEKDYNLNEIREKKKKDTKYILYIEVYIKEQDEWIKKIEKKLGNEVDIDITDGNGLVNICS